VVPFISQDGGGVLESSTRKKLSNTLKSLFGNEVKHLISQLQTLGLMPLELQRVLNLVTQHYKGNVTIVAQPSLQSFRNILTNPNYQEYEEAIHSSYICTLQSKRTAIFKYSLEISLIRAVYGVEREFDRYYMRLKHSALEVNAPMRRMWQEEDHELEALESG